MNINEALKKATPGPLYVGDPIRNPDCLGLCIEHEDGGEVFCETVVEVLPSTDDNSTQKHDAALLAHCYNHLPDVLKVATGEIQHDGGEEETGIGMVVTPCSGKCRACVIIAEASEVKGI